MNRLTIIFGVSILYLIITTLVSSMAAKKTKDTYSFMTAKNQLGPFVVGILIMSEFIGTGSTLGTAQTAFTSGISVIWNVVTLGVGFLLYAFFMASKYNELGEYTISGALSHKYGSSTRMIVSLIMIYALTTVNVSMYTGGAATVSSLLNISTPAGIAIIAAASIISLAAGGLGGIGKANLIHIAVKYVSLIVVAIVAWSLLQKHPGALAKLPQQHFSLAGIGWPTVIAWTLANIGAVFSTQYVLQTISSLNSGKDAKKASIIAGITIMPIAFLATFIGVAARALFPQIKSVMALPVFINEMNPWLSAIVVIGIIAATLVTMLACQIGATALVMKDFYIPLVKPGERHKLIATRVISVIIGLLPIPFALFVPGILKTLFFARALRTAVAVIAVFMFYLPHFGSNKSANVGLIGGIIVTTIWFILGNPWGIDNIYIAILMPAIAILLERVIFKKKLVNNKYEGTPHFPVTASSAKIGL